MRFIAILFPVALFASTVAAAPMPEHHIRSISSDQDLIATEWAQAFNKASASRSPGSKCANNQDIGPASCAGGEIAECDDGILKAKPCPNSGERCFALPIREYSTRIYIQCVTQEVAEDHFKHNPGGITGT